MKIPSDANLGAMAVDWAKREIDWFGLDGCGDAEPEEVLAFADENRHKTVWFLVYWKDADQLAVHDEAGFREECKDDEEEE